MRSLSLIISLVTLLMQGGVHAKEPLVIYASHWPPFWIDKGPLKGQGILNHIATSLQEELPQYDFQFVSSTLARTEENMRKGKKGCNLAVLKTPDRMKYYRFSDPYARIMGNGLVLPRGSLKRVQRFIDHEGHIDLPQLFEHSPVLMRVPKGRSFGVKIDPLLKKIQGTHQLYYLTGAGSLNLAFEAFQRDELAGTIIYPIEMTYLARQTGMEDEVVFLPIKGAVDFIEGHVACSNGDWSLPVVEDLNAALARMRAKGKVMAAVSRWLPLGVLEAHETENEKMNDEIK